MKTEFEVILRGRTEATPGILEQQGDLWFCESDSVSCFARDPKSALEGALGIVRGQEIWNSTNVNEGGLPSEARIQTWSTDNLGV